MITITNLAIALNRYVRIIQHMSILATTIYRTLDESMVLDSHFCLSSHTRCLNKDNILGFSVKRIPSITSLHALGLVCTGISMSSWQESLSCTKDMSGELWHGHIIWSYFSIATNNNFTCSTLMSRFSVFQLIRHSIRCSCRSFWWCFPVINTFYPESAYRCDFATTIDGTVHLGITFNGDARFTTYQG